MVHISGGLRAILENPFLIFKSKDCRYPIRKVAESIPGVCYRTGEKGQIDQRVIYRWVQEQHARPRLPLSRKHVFFVDNCSVHSMTDEPALNLGKSILRLATFPQMKPIFSTDRLIFIQKKNASLSKRWDQYKAGFSRNIGDNCPYDTRFGTIPNHGKASFLKFAAQAVCDVNDQHDDTEMTY